MLPTEDDLRTALTAVGFTCRECFGETWERGTTTCVIGANEVVVVSRDPRVERRLNRAKGGLILAIECVKNL